MPGCVTEADAITNEHSYPLGDKPLINFIMENSPRTTELQNKMLSFSHNSKQMIVEKSGHFIIIDKPDVVRDE